MANANDQQILNSLLDATLDDLADLPSLEAWPTGAYNVRLNADLKVINDKAAVEIKLELLNVEEIPEIKEDDFVPSEKDRTSILFVTGNEIGDGKLKEFLKATEQYTGDGNLRERIENMKNLEVVVVLKRRYDKKNDVNRNEIVKVL